MIILGIDPGTAATGYGIIRARAGLSKLLEYGCITTSKTLNPATRLWEIYRDLEKLIKKYKPQILAVESIFFYKNQKTAIAVAQSKGVILACGQKHKLKIREYTPLQVKSSLTGYGRAEKQQVQFMVKALLNLREIPKPDDAADALAIALCAGNQKYPSGGISLDDI